MGTNTKQPNQTPKRNTCLWKTIGPLHDPVTWYKVTQAGTQVARWDFQDKGKSKSTGTSCFVLEVPLCKLRQSMCDFVSSDQIMQRAYFHIALLALLVKQQQSVIFELSCASVSKRVFVQTFRMKMNMKAEQISTWMLSYEDSF